MNHTFPSIDYVMSLTPGGMRDGRDNVLKLMKILGNPQDDLKVFHVTGSNGKGSVCQMISQVLWKEFHKKVGLFTSPHFLSINERFQINGVIITDERLEHYYQHVLKLAKKHTIPLSFFEIQVVVMVLYFREEEVDYAVVEVGLGGTYDGTNIFSHPLACFITSITLEHTHVLGKTRISVLKNKLGILKPGTQLYTPIKNKTIIEACKKIGVKLNSAKKPGKNITNLPGNHQQQNAQMVLESLSDLGFEKKKILSALQKIYNPGRFEWLSPTLLVDTANNTENIQILSKMIKEIKTDKKIVVIFGTTQTEPMYAKKLANMIYGDDKILVDDFCDRSLPYSEYASGVKDSNTLHVFGETEKIQKILENDDILKIVYGSFYLVGEIMRLSRYKPFAMV